MHTRISYMCSLQPSDLMRSHPGDLGDMHHSIASSSSSSARGSRLRRLRQASVKYALAVDPAPGMLRKVWTASSPWSICESRPEQRQPHDFLLCPSKVHENVVGCQRTPVARAVTCRTRPRVRSPASFVGPWVCWSRLTMLGMRDV